MARITVEDCLEKIPNRFELVLTAARRARQLARGTTPLVEEENDKSTVVALREIALGVIDESIMNDQKREPSPEDEFEIPSDSAGTATAGES